MAAAPYTRRIPKRFKKTITFDSVTHGAIGAETICTVTGAVVITHGSIRCTTLLASGGGTVELGTAGATAALVAQTLATDIDADEFWQDATPELRVSPGIANINIGGNIILTVAGFVISAGVLEFVFYWLPLSDDGNLV